MSREQRRMDRKQSRQASATPPPPPSRRTPVKAPGGGGPPWAAIGIAGGTMALVLLIVYLVVQARGDSGASLSKSEKAEQNSSSDLPGTYVQSQGRGHFSYTFSLTRTPTPFCAGVEKAAGADPAVSATPSGATTPAANATPAASATTAATSAATAAGSTPASTNANGTPNATPTVPTNCYNSNPPSSGKHLNVQRNVDIGNGARVNIPPDPDVYPSDIVIPREAIAHALEHAGVFVGYNCAEGDSACDETVKKIEDLVNDRIDNHDDRVIMARDPDLVVGTIGVASWTRVMNFPYADYDKGKVEDFIGTHSCRFDPENICR